MVQFVRANFARGTLVVYADSGGQGADDRDGGEWPPSWWLPGYEANTFARVGTESTLATPCVVS